MSGDAEHQYFADGIAEDIITGLSRSRWLFVIARNSSFAYKGRNADVPHVGRELGVRHILEGSVRKGGNRVRIPDSVSRQIPAISYGRLGMKAALFFSQARNFANLGRVGCPPLPVRSDNGKPILRAYHGSDRCHSIWAF